MFFSFYLGALFIHLDVIMCSSMKLRVGRKAQGRNVSNKTGMDFNCSYVTYMFRESYKYFGVANLNLINTAASISSEL